MKKFLTICLMAALSLGASAAEKKEKVEAEVVSTVFITDIDCDGCVAKITNNVTMLGRGIKDVDIDLPSKEVCVTYDSSKNNDEKLIKGFSRLAVVAAVKE